MADDPLSRFTSKFRKAPPAVVPAAAPPPSLVVNHGTGGREAYEAYEPFENEVRTSSVELRCCRSGLSYFIPYAHLGVVVYNFRTGKDIFFTGGGYAVTIAGRNLRAIVMALRLHTCGTIQDFHPDIFAQPQPEDPLAPFVEAITVEVLHSPNKLLQNKE